MSKKNLLYIFADQWSASFMSHMGGQVSTPNMDAFAKDSYHFKDAISTYPLCSPHRASLLTGKYPFSCGFWTNCKIGIDEKVGLDPQEITITDTLHFAGYKNAYLGKYHLDASALNFTNNPPAPIKNWNAYTPPGERRHHVDFWYSYGADDNHMNPHYWTGDNPNAIMHENEWSPDIETNLAIDFIDNIEDDTPFSVIISWNPPHSPYDQVPEEYKKIYENIEIDYRENVPEHFRTSEKHRRNYINYLACVHGLDVCFGRIINYLKDNGLYDDTVIVLSADHGDCMGSHALMGKNVWYEESINIPLYIKGVGTEVGVSDALLASQDHMPTVLDLLGVEIPATVEGKSFAPIMRGEKMQDEPDEAFICMMPGMPNIVQSFRSRGLNNKCFGWRGIRTKTQTFVVHNGEEYGKVQQKLVYDNVNDPYQLNPTIPTGEELKGWEELLQKYLDMLNDPFLIDLSGIYSEGGGRSDTLKDMLIANRSYRNYNNDVKVTYEELKDIVELTRYCATGGNIQALRYRIVCDDKEVAEMHKLVKFGALLKELNLPYTGNDPTAYLVICAESENSNNAPHATNIGIAAQTMLLGAVARGYGGCMIGNFDKAAATELLDIKEGYHPLLAISLGAPKENCVVRTIRKGEPTAYYRGEGDCHVVPKIALEDLLI